jgi:hypothetical protein
MVYYLNYGGYNFLYIWCEFCVSAIRLLFLVAGWWKGGPLDLSHWWRGVATVEVEKLMINGILLHKIASAMSSKKDM